MPIRKSRVDRSRLLWHFNNRPIREGLKLENDTRSFLSEFQVQLRQPGQQMWGRNRTSSSLCLWSWMWNSSQPLAWVSSANHLGNEISETDDLEIDSEVKRAKLIRFCWCEKHFHLETWLKFSERLSCTAVHYIAQCYGHLVGHGQVKFSEHRTQAANIFTRDVRSDVWANIHLIRKGTGLDVTMGALHIKSALCEIWRIHRRKVTVRERRNTWFWLGLKE